MPLKTDFCRYFLPFFSCHYITFVNVFSVLYISPVFTIKMYTLKWNPCLVWSCDAQERFFFESIFLLLSSSYFSKAIVNNLGFLRTGKLTNMCSYLMCDIRSGGFLKCSLPFCVIYRFGNTEVKSLLLFQSNNLFDGTCSYHWTVINLYFMIIMNLNLICEINILFIPATRIHREQHSKSILNRYWTVKCVCMQQN